jgi:apolipoprotein D and lipocalin family protein
MPPHTPSTPATRHPRALPWWPLALGAAAAGTAYALAKGLRVRVPKGITPVQGFEARHYMGDWFELARIEQYYEQGLVNTQARYAFASDGSVSVTNRGYDPARKRWRLAQGRAVFLGDTDRAALKVSFWGPFYAGYNVVALDPDYRWALVMGSTPSALWILSRSPELPAAVRRKLLGLAKGMGVDIQQILWVPQDTAAPAAPDW